MNSRSRMYANISKFSSGMFAGAIMRFLHDLQDHDEQKSIAAYRKLMTLPEYAHLPTLELSLTITIPDKSKLSSSSVSISPFGYAIYHGYKELVALMITSWSPLINEAISAPDTHYHHYSLLMLACNQDYVDMVGLLIEHKAWILQCSADHDNVLNNVRSIQMAELLINAAEEKNCLDQLLKDGAKNRDFFCGTCDLGLAGLAFYYFERLGETLFRYTPVEKALDKTRGASWQFPHLYAEFHQLCLLLRTRPRKSFAVHIPLSAHPAEITPPLAYLSLFGTAPVSHIKVALAQCLSILNNPERCLPYIEWLNANFERYCLETYGRVHSLAQESYQFNVIFNLLYPIPNHDYQGINKQSALQSFLVTFFRRYGLAEKCYKWIGFIPPHVSNKQIANGFFFTEDRFDIGLYHNKLAHMLQQAMLILAHETKAISMQNVSLQHIFEAMTTEPTQKDGSYAWTAIRDHITYNAMTFADPFRLSQFIMHSRASNQFVTLADYMIDSFCKGYRRQLQFLNESLGGRTLSSEDYLSQLNDCNQNQFGLVDSSVAYAVARDQRKGKNASQTGDWALLEKSYLENTSFEFSPFRSSRIPSNPHPSGHRAQPGV